jgi:hypothetical protein
VGEDADVDVGLGVDVDVDVREDVGWDVGVKLNDSRSVAGGAAASLEAGARTIR